MADFTNRNADETKEFILTFDENGGSPEYTKIEDANGVDRTAEVVELLGINDKASLSGDTDVTVTVGDSADFSSINDAIDFLSRKHPIYKKEGFSAEIKLLSGFVMSEQIIVKGIDLSWIVITGEDSETTIERSSLTTEVTIQRGGTASTPAEDIRYPAFAALNGGALPGIKVLFQMNDSGDSDARDFINLHNSRAIVYPECGCKKAAHYALYAIGTSIASAHFAIFDETGERGLYAYGGARISAGRVSIKDSGGAGSPASGDKPVYATQGSWINVREAVLTGNKAGYRSNAGAVEASAGSWIEAEGADVSGSGNAGFYATRGSHINASSGSSNRPTKANNCGSHAAYALGGSFIAFNVVSSGVVEGKNAGDSAILANVGSKIVAEGADVSGAGERGVACISSDVEARGADLSGCGDSAVVATNGYVNARGADLRNSIDSSGVCVFANHGAKIIIRGAETSGDEIAINNGSTITANDVTGNPSFSQDINTVTGSGIIFG